MYGSTSPLSRSACLSSARQAPANVPAGVLDKRLPICQIDSTEKPTFPVKQLHRRQAELQVKITICNTGPASLIRGGALFSETSTQPMAESQDGSVRVTAAILENQGRIFIARRGPGGHLAGKWELPGGKVEDDESPEQCLARELREEFDLTVSVDAYVGASTHRYGHMTIELMVYRVRRVSGEPVALVHTDFRWVAPDELKHYDFAPADAPFVRKLERGEIDIRSTPATR